MTDIPPPSEILPIGERPSTALVKRTLSRGLADYSRLRSMAVSATETCMTRGDAGGTGRFQSHGPVKKPHLLWSAVVDAHHSPQIAVAGKRLFVPTSGQIRCYELETGKRIWDFPDVFDPDRVWPQTATILVNSTLIVRGDECLFAIDQASGLKVWEYRQLSHGRWISDHVANDSFAYVVDGDALVCINARTGQRDWIMMLSELDPSIRSGFGSILLLSDQGLMFGSTDHRVWCVDTRLRELLWSLPIPFGDSVSGLCFGFGRLFASCDQGVFALDPIEGIEIWRGEAFAATPPSISDRFLCASADSLQLLLWSLPRYLRLYPDLFFEGCEPDDRYAFSYQRDEEEEIPIDEEEFDNFVTLSTVLESRNWRATPTPTEDGLYCADENGNVYFCDSSARLRWRVKAPGRVTAPILAANNRLIVPLNTGTFGKAVDRIAVLGAS